MGQFVRFRGCIPHIEDEGIFIQKFSVPRPCTISDLDWHRSLSPWERLATHHTLNSARKFHGFIPTKAPKDSLDFILTSNFDPTVDIFPEKVDIVLQPDTIGMPTWRRLRNDLQLPPKPQVPLGHPLCIGGIKEKIDPNYVKLMNSGPHSPQTNAGYVRNGQGGNMFYY